MTPAALRTMLLVLAVGGLLMPYGCARDPADASVPVSFVNVSQEAGVHGERVRWGSGSTFLDYDRDGDLDLFVANFIELDIETLKTPLDPDPCLWKGLPRCGFPAR